MIKINPKLIKDDQEYSISLTPFEAGAEPIKHAIVLTGRDIKDIMQHLFWSTQDAYKSNPLSDKTNSIISELIRGKPRTNPKTQQFEVIHPDKSTRS